MGLEKLSKLKELSGETGLIKRDERRQMEEKSKAPSVKHQAYMCNKYELSLLL